MDPNRSHRTTGGGVLRNSALLLSVALLVSACAEFPSAPAPVAIVQAPTLAAGDRWVYRQINPYNNTLVQVLTDTLEPTGRGFTLTLRSDRGPSEREVVPAPWQLAAESGPLPRRFTNPLVQIRFPLRPGSVWHQQVRVVDAYGNRYDWITVGHALGWKRVTTPAGTFSALKVVLQMNLGDGNGMWGNTHVYEVLWYAPRVKRWVRRELRYWRVERTNIPRVEKDWKVWELASYSVRP